MQDGGTPGRWAAAALTVALAVMPLRALAGAQAEEHLAPVGGGRAFEGDLRCAGADQLRESGDRQPWLAEMSQRLASKIPDERERLELLATVHYEAKRAGLDPQLVLGVMYHESGFKKYAVSTAGARGYMQVMPFWVGLIGQPDQNLFHLRTNLRYGAVILRHYLDIENGDFYARSGATTAAWAGPNIPTRSCRR